MPNINYIGSNDLQYTLTKLKTILDGKQETLPTVVNNRVLHTNASTGDLEWADIQSGDQTRAITNAEIDTLF